MEGRVRGLGMFLLSFRLHSEREKEREREREREREILWGRIC